MSSGEYSKEIEKRLGELPSKGKGYWGWWLIVTVSFAAAVLPWFWRNTHWRALGVTTAIFATMMFVVENWALYWHWWIWNGKIMWGPKVGLVPLEEFLIYFAIVPALVAMQNLVQSGLRKWLKGGGN